MKRVTLSGASLGLTSLCCLHMVFMPCKAQVSSPGRPLEVNYPGAPPLKVVELSITEQQKMISASSSSSPLKPAASGVLIDVNLNPSLHGVWDTLSNGLKVWRLAVSAKEASQMRLILSPYRLTGGVRVFLFNPSQITTLGAFTSLNNKSINLLGTSLIPDDTLVIEMQVPPAVPDFGALEVRSVGLDFMGPKHTDLLKVDPWYGSSDFCQVDINCLNNPIFQMLKHSVVRIIYNGTSRCTGTLVNNTRQDAANYILTAEHCISSEYIANNAVFYFNYESPSCSGSDGDNQKTISGATLRATGNTLDFTLLELLEPVPFTYKPYYVGWDNQAYSPSSGVSIHHPQGDVKKICQENHLIEPSNFGYGYDLGTHWHVRHWESGTTEAGSSGSPLFDQHHRVVGSLTGGLADCADPQNDYFQMFSHCWSDYGSPNRQLAYWLDPFNQSARFLNGYDPYLAFWQTGDTLTHILEGESVGTIENGLAWGSFGGHNADLLSGFAEHFTTENNKHILGLEMDVARNYFSAPDRSLTVLVWKGGGMPEDVIYEKAWPLCNLTEDASNFIPFDSLVAAGKDFYVGFRLNYAVPQDTFSVAMAENRPEGPNTCLVYDGSSWQSLASFTLGTVQSSYAMFPVVSDTITPDPYSSPFTEQVIAYPNPASEFVWFEFKELLPDQVEITLHNLQGQVLAAKTYGPFQHFIRMSTEGLEPGFYMARIRQGPHQHVLKLILKK